MKLKCVGFEKLSQKGHSSEYSYHIVNEDRFSEYVPVRMGVGEFDILGKAILEMSDDMLPPDVKERFKLATKDPSTRWYQPSKKVKGEAKRDQLQG